MQVRIKSMAVGELFIVDNFLRSPSNIQQNRQSRLRNRLVGSTFSITALFVEHCCRWANHLHPLHRFYYDSRGFLSLIRVPSKHQVFLYIQPLSSSSKFFFMLSSGQNSARLTVILSSLSITLKLLERKWRASLFMSPQKCCVFLENILQRADTQRDMLYHLMPTAGFIEKRPNLKTLPLKMLTPYWIADWSSRDTMQCQVKSFLKFLVLNI